MKYLFLLSVVFFLSTSLVPCADTEGTGDSTQAWLAAKFNPSQTCPYCHKEFSENRSIWMLLVGFLGQAFFTSRFLVQWIASERRQESYIPHIFWYLSIIGSLMLLAYAISIMAWPVIMGQMFGVIVYTRNLALIAKGKHKVGDES